MRMLKSFEKLFFSFIDLVLPRRSDFEIVKNLKPENILNLPQSPKIEGTSWIFPLFHYKDKRVKAIIWELKYRGNTTVLEYIGKLLFDEIIPLVSDVVIFNQDAQFILVPIPISNQRRTERGYNQSEYIAKAILENDFGHTLLYAPQWFQKIKDTPIQSRSQSREDRMKNLTDCFEADPRVDGKYVILIDDVVTTGSTLLEARKTLLEAGARDVFAFTIAH
jgi:ComF family protein